MITTHDKKLIALLAQVILITASMTACNRGQDAGALISEAKSYEQKGEPKAAIIQLKNVLQKNPDNADARSLLGTIYYETGDTGSAEKELRKALELGAKSDDLLPTLGKTLLLERQFQQALDAVTQPAGAAPDARYLAVRGNAYLGLGKMAEAKQAFDLALKANPDSADALIGSAKQSLMERDMDTAVRFIDRVTASNPANVDGWLFKGDLLRAQKKIDEAHVAYAKASELKPENLSAHIAIAHLQIEAGKFDAAKAELETAKKHDPKSLLITYTEALLAFKQGKYAAARESIQQVLRVAPDHMPSLLLAGAVEYALGATQQAEQHLKKFLERTPDNAYASQLLVATLLKNGQTARAVRTLEPLLKSGETNIRVLALAGETYMQAKDYAKATEYFEKASALAPETATIRTALGVSRLAQGDNARGIAELERATTLDSKPTQSGILLVMTHMRLHEFDKALAVLAKLEKSEPDNPLLQNLKGGIYATMNNPAAARSSFEKALALKPEYFPAVANLARLDTQEKKPEAARKRFASFLDAHQKSVPAMTALADVALSQGNKDEATAWLERASNVKPDDVKPALRLAAHYLHIAEKQKAFALAQKLQGNHPDDPDVVDMVAQTQLANNDGAAALQSYKKLIALVPDSALARVRIAAVYMAMKDQDAAADALKVAVSLKPDFLEAELALATLSMRKGNQDQALKIARQIQKQPRNAAAGYQLEGDVLMVQQKPEPAVKAYEQAFAARKNGRVLVKLHEALARVGKEKDGEARLAQWLTAHPEDTSTRMYLATAYFTGQQTKSAIEQYQAVLQADPKNAGALNNLALAYQKANDPRALQLAEKAYDAAPQSAAVMDTLGWLLVESHKTDRGLPLLQKAATLAPTVPEIRYHLAHGLLKSGDKVKARAELTQLLASGKSFPQMDEAKTLLRQLQ